MLNFLLVLSSESISTLVLQFVTLCILILCLCCSQIFFPGLKEKDFHFFFKLLKPLARCRGINKVTLADFIVLKRFDACKRFLHSVLCNTNHCLHATFTHSSTRSTFKLLLSCTTTCRNDLITYPVRIPVNCDDESVELQLRCQCIFPLHYCFIKLFALPKCVCVRPQVSVVCISWQSTESQNNYLTLPC